MFCSMSKSTRRLNSEIAVGSKPVTEFENKSIRSNIARVFISSGRLPAKLLLAEIGGGGIESVREGDVATKKILGLARNLTTYTASIV